MFKRVETAKEVIQGKIFSSNLDLFYEKSLVRVVQNKNVLFNGITVEQVHGARSGSFIEIVDNSKVEIRSSTFKGIIIPLIFYRFKFSIWRSYLCSAKKLTTFEKV